MHNTNITQFHDNLISTTHYSSESSESCATSNNSKNKWATQLLIECSRAISEKDSCKTHQILWMLNELASPYGDSDQKLAHYFLQALFCKVSGSGELRYKTLISVAEKSQSFDSTSRSILKFQEASPWMTFGHVASNGAILDALAGETKLHIIDISNTLCTQWPTFLEALATRNDDAPHLKLTLVVTSSVIRSILKETRQKMEKFARLMGVPFELAVITELDHIGQLKKESLKIQDDEAVAVNCIGALRNVPLEERSKLIRFFETLNPKIVTVVEEEADFASTSDDFFTFFQECLRFYKLYFEMLHESFKIITCNERLMLERECSKSIIRVLACDDVDEHKGECEKREKGAQWSEKLNQTFSPFRFNDDVLDDVKALLKRYVQEWSTVQPQERDFGIYLKWKEVPVVWASAWKP